MAKSKAVRKSSKSRAKSRKVRPKAPDREQTPSPRPGLSFPVVAIGASARGLAAFTALLKALPPQSGMAFVLIQHLEPKHESALTTLLSKATSMPVVEVSDGIAVEPNCVYVIPPNKDMTIAKGVLRLAPRSGASSDISQRRQLEQAAQARAEDVRALAARLLTAQEDERRRVARELHDQICQQLAALAMDISAHAAAPAPRPQERERYLKSLQARIVRAAEEARHIAYQLHPSILDDLGLVASLRDLCKQFSKRNPETALEFTDNALGAVVPLEIASCVYRVAQEGLNNIASHARARRVSVVLSRLDGTLKLTTTDDGAGFDPAVVKGLGRLGLIGMEERAHLVKGELSIHSQPDRGTQIALQIPLTAATL